MGGKVGLRCKSKTLLEVVNKRFTLECFAGKNETKSSNVHDSLKVMGSNPVYLLKYSLLYLEKNLNFSINSQIMNLFNCNLIS